MFLKKFNSCSFHYTKVFSVLLCDCKWILIHAWKIISNSSNSSNKISSFWKTWLFLVTHCTLIKKDNNINITLPWWYRIVTNAFSQTALKFQGENVKEELLATLSIFVCQFLWFSKIKENTNITKPVDSKLLHDGYNLVKDNYLIIWRN